MPSKHIIFLNDQNFSALVLQNKQPTLVDFWAEWCEPCHQISPLIDAIADAYHAKLQIGKFDIDINPKIPADYNIRSIPTLMFFQKGRVVGQLVGAISKVKMEQFITECLNKA